MNEQFTIERNGSEIVQFEADLGSAEIIFNVFWRAETADEFKYALIDEDGDEVLTVSEESA